MSDTTPKEPSSFRLIFTLTLAGLISGFGIVSAYELTLPTILANQAKALRLAVFKVVPGSTSMKKMVPDEQHEGRLRLATKADKKKPGLYAAYDKDGHFKGFAVLGEGPGFQDTVRLLFGYDPIRKKLIGIEILENRETPGLGNKIDKDKAWQKENFSHLSLEPKVIVLKKKPGVKRPPHAIDAITGATISSKAVVKIINNASARWLRFMRKPLPDSPMRVVKKRAP